MVLKLGLLSNSVVWENLLNRLGLSYELLDVKNLKALETGVSCIIVDQSLPENSVEDIKKYYQDGGAVLDTGKNIEHFISGKTVTTKIKHLYPDSNSPFSFYDIVDTVGEVDVHSGAQWYKKTLGIWERGKGLVAFTGFRFCEVLSNTESCRRSFPSSTKYNPNEAVSLISKGAYERFLFELLKLLHIKRNIPFVHKWFFPGDAENVLIFRVDSDFGTKENVSEWNRLLSANGLKSSWYLHTQGHSGWLAKFRTFPNMEIGVHGFDHIYAREYELQKENVQKAIADIEQNGLLFNGYASPYGMWDTTLNRICQELDFAYSSEFVYSYDALPGFPIIDGVESQPLQVPIHPICIGSLKTAKMSRAEMKEYFRKQFKLKLRQNSPVVFYDHPNHEHISLMVELLQEFRESGIVNVTMGEYAQWWKKREPVSFETDLDDQSSTISIQSENAHDDTHFAVWLDENSRLLCKSDEKISLKRIRNDNSEKTVVGYNVSELRKSRRFNLRRLKHEFLVNKIFRKDTVF